MPIDLESAIAAFNAGARERCLACRVTDPILSIAMPYHTCTAEREQVEAVAVAAVCAAVGQPRGVITLQARQHGKTAAFERGKQVIAEIHRLLWPERGDADEDRGR